jgi:hypothetical protein
VKTPSGIRKDGSISRSMSRSVGRSFTATGMFLKKQLWVWPLIVAVILGALGVWLRGTVEGVMKAQMAGDLQVILGADVEALRLAFRAHQALAQLSSDDPRVRSLVREMVATPGHDPAELLRSPRLPELRAAPRPWMERYEYDGFILFDPKGRIVAAQRDALIGKIYPAEDAEFIAEAIQGRSGVDVAGYRDYRGVPSIGAWTWLPEYGIGIATEVDKAEAYRSLVILRTAFWSLFALLGAAAVAIFVFTVLMARLRLKMQKAALDVRQLGCYALDEKIGEGGMGPSTAPTMPCSAAPPPSSCSAPRRPTTSPSPASSARCN